MDFDLSRASSSQRAAHLLSGVMDGGGFGDAFDIHNGKSRKSKSGSKHSAESKPKRESSSSRRSEEKEKKHHHHHHKKHATTTQHKQHHETREEKKAAAAVEPAPHHHEEKRKHRASSSKKKSSTSTASSQTKIEKASKSAKLRKQKAKQAIVSSNLLHFPMLCTSCGGCSVDPCGCGAPLVNVNDGSSQCDKNAIFSSLYGFVVLTGTVIPFLVNWDSDNNLVLTPNTAGGFVLADIDTAFGFNRTFSTTQRRVTRVGDTVAIANMVDTTLNTFYIVEEINATGYVLRPLRFSHRSCLRPKVNDVWRIRYGASKSMYTITSLTDCTDLWTFAPTLNNSVTNYELMHVACKLIEVDTC